MPRSGEARCRLPRSPFADDVAPLSVLRGDITTVATDAIVNAANSGLIGGGGVDGVIHRAGGPSILDECRLIVARQGGCPPGDAVITGAGALPARHVIHTVGPVWRGSDAAGCDTTLGSCYGASLDLAAAHDLRTVAFPNISTGIYGYPKDRAADVAIASVRDWLTSHPGVIDEVMFVCFDVENERLYRARLPGG